MYPTNQNRKSCSYGIKLNAAPSHGSNPMNPLSALIKNAWNEIKIGSAMEKWIWPQQVGIQVSFRIVTSRHLPGKWWDFKWHSIILQFTAGRWLECNYSGPNMRLCLIILLFVICGIDGGVKFKWKQLSSANVREISMIECEIHVIWSCFFSYWFMLNCR